MKNRFQQSYWKFCATFASLFKLPYLKYFGCCDWSKKQQCFESKGSEIEERKTAFDSAVWVKQNKMWKENQLPHAQNMSKKIGFMVSGSLIHGGSQFLPRSQCTFKIGANKFSPLPEIQFCMNI